MNAAELRERAFELFDQVCDLSPDQRDEYLAQHCDDPALRDAVTALLREDDNDDAFLDASRPSAALDAMTARVLDDESPLPERIGGYRILRRVGQGGMGVIYEAEQESPKRRVALKLLQPGLMSRDLLRRFQHEAHVLGQLQHAGIAHIHEAGWAELQHGRQPFFAMEFIDGLPLDHYAKERNLTTRERLELLARVCDAVQHAHQKGIIHRDLKPANVLVVQHEAGGTALDARKSKVVTATTADAIGQPKVLDFGIARVTDADLQTVTMHTQVGQLVGTLAYMSPEQVSGNSDELDTRCDVYALGVMLYELLAGSRPHEMTGVPVPEAVRMVQEDEPTLLGARDRALRGDIETIVAKAMEKERERRYASATELATDIRRYLANQPIEARPATTFYQLRRFAARNKGLVAGLATTFVMLVVALIATGYGLVQSNARRAAAVAANEQLQSVVNYQSAMLERIDVAAMGQQIVADLRVEARSQLSGEDDTVAAQLAAFEQVLSRINGATIANRALDTSIMSPAVAALDHEFADQPELRADLRSSLTEIYDEIGLDEKSLAQAQHVLATLRETYGDDSEGALRTRQRICGIQLQLGDFEQAEREARELLADQRRLLGADHIDTAVTQRLLGNALTQLTRPDEAETELSGAIDTLIAVAGPEHEETLLARAGLAEHYHKQRDFKQARSIYEEILAVHERRDGPDHERTLDVLRRISQMHFLLNEHEIAIEHLTRICTAQSKVLGADHPDTLASRRDLANALTELGRYDEAEPILEDTLSRQRRTVGSDHPSTVTTLSAALRLMIKTQRWEAAEQFGLEALEIARRTLGEDNSRTVSAVADVAFVYHKSGQLELAERWTGDQLAAYQRVYGHEHKRTMDTQQQFAKVLIAAGKFESALELLEPILEICRAQYSDSLILAGSLGQTVTVLVALDRGAEAETHARELLAWCEDRGGNDAIIAKCQLWIARTLIAQDQYAEAHPLVSEAIERIGDPQRAPWYLHMGRLLDQVIAMRLTDEDRSEQALEQLEHLDESRLRYYPEDYNTIIAEMRSLMHGVGIAPDRT